MLDDHVPLFHELCWHFIDAQAQEIFNHR